jgi:glycosyltransferase involved in cell wall biosynthesis
MNISQVNFQRYFGGGEVFTGFLCRALDCLGVTTQLLVNPKANFWHTINLPSSTQIIAIENPARLIDYFRTIQPLWVIGHGPFPRAVVETIHAGNGLATAIAHMPVQGRNPAAFHGHNLIIPVSRWVRDGLLSAQLPTWPEPLYGVADFSQTYQGGAIRRKSRYEWDRRKGRDRLLSLGERVMGPLFRYPTYQRRPGITIGVVSRLTPIKQFPLMFKLLSPVLAENPDVNLEIFGAGGFATVRDLQRTLAPLANRARFWGYQTDRVGVYRSIDYLLTGLPEKEALGLNVIEAQACGTPVLAPCAPPFDETVLENITGYFFRDPREDQGVDFQRLLAQLSSLADRPDPRLAREHLARFSFDSFCARISSLLSWVNDQRGYEYSPRT